MSEIRWTRSALRDLESIHRYIAKDNTEVADAVVSRIQDLEKKLALYPFIGKPGRKETTRELFVTRTTFVIVYRVVEQTVQILRILHTSQKYP